MYLPVAVEVMAAMHFDPLPHFLHLNQSQTLPKNNKNSNCLVKEEPDKVDNTAIKKTSSNESQKKVEAKKEAQVVKPKAMGAQNNKQSSIMSFFQKK